MKNYGLIIAVLFLTLFIVNCKKEPQPEQWTENKPKETGNLVINKNIDQLKTRIALKNEVIPITNTEKPSSLKSFEDFPEVDLTKNYAFVLKAEVAPPVYEGNTLQATHVTIHNNYAFVSYNTVGSEWIGGIEVFDVSDIDNPLIIASAILPNSDVNAIDYANGKVYVVGATGDYRDSGFVSPAFMEVISLDQSMNFENVDAYQDLLSYAGTDISHVEDRIFTTSGSEGGLTIFDQEYSIIGTEAISDARSVDANSSHLYVLQGREGRINVFGLSNGSLQETYHVGGATVSGAKSEISVSNEYIFAALNEGGLSILNLDGSLKQNIPRPVSEDGDFDEDDVTNSVSLNGDLVLLGNGGAGIYVGGMIAELDDSVKMLGAMDFNSSESANFVESHQDVIFVATGLGGLKIISVTIDEGVPDDIEPTEPCASLLSGISDQFPERIDARDLHQDLFSDTAHTHIVVTEETPVYISFIDEGAWWRNSFGYYAYPADTPPQNISDLEKHIIFPNVSKVGEGGGLQYGDRVQIGDGNFPAGTVIGFFLVIKGWKNGLTVEGDYTHYSDKRFNANQEQQSTLFVSSNCNDIVHTFEDIRLDKSYCDFDYNDIIVTIKDTTDSDVPNSRLKIAGLPRK